MFPLKATFVNSAPNAWKLVYTLGRGERGGTERERRGERGAGGELRGFWEQEGLEEKNMRSKSSVPRLRADFSKK